MRTFTRQKLLVVVIVFGGLMLVGRQTRADTPQPSVGDRVDFSRDVRPILSNHCWNCHGPDEATRQAKLRLDGRDAALSKGESGQIAVVPGKPELSEVATRIASDDEDTVMPPVHAKKPLSAAQKETLKRWIAQGADFTQHWAFVTPQRSQLPKVKRNEWARNAIDLLVLKRLEDEGLAPSPEVDKATWLRRVTLDLTGLPPSPNELAAFLGDSSPAAHETVVDRLLASPRYAERMAMHWLDAARFADTNGYNNDETRTMWPWRDWVIESFATGMPYDQFLTEQLAGDLFPNATLAQRVATGFNRNHVLTTEGGVIEEEYHVEYVADRVHTTATVFMGLSMQCARCHDHKYDPLTQHDYYQFAAFFNNIPDKVVGYSQGRMAEPLLKVPSREQQAESDRLTRRKGEIEVALKMREANIDPEVARWEKSLTPAEIAKAGPVGLVAHFALDEADGDQVVDSVDAARRGTIRGKVARSPGKLGSALDFDGNTFVEAGEVGAFDSDQKFSIAAWIQLTSAEPTTVLSKMDEANAHRGYDVIMEGGKVASHIVHHWPDSGFKVITKEPVSLNEWHHVVVTYDGSRKAAGLKVFVDGQSRSLEVTNNNTLGGTLKTDKPFHIGKRQTSAAFKGRIDDVQLYSVELIGEEVISLASGQSLGQLKEILAVAPSKRTESQRTLLRQYYLARIDCESQSLKAELSELPKRQAELDKAIPVTMVMYESTPRRPTYLLRRGQYDQRGDVVKAGVPSVLRSLIVLPDGAAIQSLNNNSTGDPGGVSPRTNSGKARSNNKDVRGLMPPGSPNAAENRTDATRLDLARWLTSPAHPLTARVAVNRWWELFFGTGLVETAEDFGVQGTLPSHPELLDWLATELVRTGWDQRAILKLIVTSATYRQASRVTPQLLERDPRNRLLTRGPRYRLSAESVRDNALAVSGLLRERLGGASVKPYQPEGLWEDVSVERRDKYVIDSDEGLYRRSMYTFWKRTCPPPGMTTFDAPDREFCLIRRARTNTPLQALVLLNDPTFVEAARKLAERVLAKTKGDDERLSLACELVLSRQPSVVEREVLSALLRETKGQFARDKGAAEKLLSVGRSIVAGGQAVEELAAWTAIASMLLNLDEAISKT